MSGNPDILIRHDHEGCDIYHHLHETDDKSNGGRTWKTKRWDASIRQVLRSNKTVPGIREITLQSMMGEFRGNASFLSAN